MGTAVAKRSIWTVIANNPFPYFHAETFRAGVAARLQAYAGRVGGRVTSPQPQSEIGEIFRLQLTELPFPDGPGRSVLDVSAYKAFGRLYLSLVVDHDRLFRSLDGEPGGRLYLHDFKFVRSYGPDRPPALSEIDEALEGLERARRAVESRNRAVDPRSPLARIRVALARTPDDDEGTTVPSEAGESAAETVERRKEVIEALREQGPESEQEGPRKIQIRRRPSEEEEKEEKEEEEEDGSEPS